MIPPQTYQQRRARLAGGISRPVVVFSGKARGRQYATNTYPFRAGSTYLYLGGPAIEGSALVIEPGSDGRQGVRLARPVGGFEDIVWVGSVPTDAELLHHAGLPESALALPEQVSTVLGGRPAGYFAPPCIPTLEWAASLGVQHADRDEVAAVVEMRLRKDEHERTAMRRAADVGMKAHAAAMAATRPGKTELDIAAALHAVFIANNCSPSFSPGVTVHGEVLHGDPGTEVLRSGQLLLADAGAEETGGYASDITRTYPVNGRFTPIQRDLYETVLRALCEAIAACVPGKRFRDVHDLAARVICEGLMDVGLLRGNADSLVERNAHTLFFTHGLGHLIGLDVHDMEDFGDLAGYAPGRTRRPEFGNKYVRLDRDLIPGMTITVEPGIYLVPAIWREESLVAPLRDCVNEAKVEELLESRFGGIRIEDTIAIRDVAAGAPEVLTRDLPKDADAVARIVGS